jgi:hypothetical protein
MLVLPINGWLGDWEGKGEGGRETGGGDGGSGIERERMSKYRKQMQVVQYMRGSSVAVSPPVTIAISVIQHPI